MLRLLEEEGDDDHHDEEDLEGHDGEGFGAGGFNSGLPHHEPEALAWFHIVFSLIYLLVGMFMLYKMFESRHVLEIRARSVYLVLTLGVCLVIDFAMNIHVECVHLFRWQTNIFATHLVFFFTVFTIEACYISRVIRLGVSFSPKTKKAIPWIMSEKLLVTVSLCIGVLSTLIPGYYFIKINGTDYLVDFVLVELEVVWKCQVGLVAVQLALLPIVWMVDDIYRISWELGVIVMLGLVDVVIVRLSATNVLTPGVKEYISSSNIGLLWSSTVFGLSVVDPLRRMTFNPMARPLIMVPSSNGHERKKHTGSDSQSRKLIMGHHQAALGLDMPDSSHHRTQGSKDISDDDSDRSKTEPNSARSNTSSKWSYDKMATMPAVAEAFRAFAWRALCQESVMFLEEVSKYERGDYEIARPNLSQFQAFDIIAKTFVVDGSQDEINISSRDKKKILDVYHGGSSIFFSLQDEERRLIFRDAYLEIRSMLETNLVHRFLSTEGFRQMNSLQEESEDRSRVVSSHI